MENTLNETLQRERPRLLAWMGARIRPEEAEDALQDIVVRSLVRLDTFEEVRDITAWVWRSARNAVIDAWRTRKRRHDAGERPEPDSFEDFVDSRLQCVHDALEERDMLDDLAEAIRNLPAEQREVIVSQSLKGETFQSIAARTGISADTLAARKRYALGNLRKSLAESGWTEALRR